MATFSYQTSLKPFWAEGADFVGGRDALGIQNSSVAVYTALLPGLNNVTDRLRYYGFYCWLLQSMEERRVSFSRRQDQDNYIRRAEYALALYMRRYEPEQTGVVGSDYAKQYCHEATVDVALGADKSGRSKEDVYWDFSSGALGQYFTGSLHDRWTGLGLLHIDEREQYYHLTEYGKELASAYGQSIRVEAAEFLISVVESGRMNMADAEVLRDLSPAAISPASAEGRFYQEMLLGADYGRRAGVPKTTYRHQSLLLLLEHFAAAPDGVGFYDLLPRIYEEEGHIGTSDESSASVGWFYYQVNERLHLSLESIFSTILHVIRKESVLFTNAVVRLTQAALDAFTEYYGDFDASMQLRDFIELVEETLGDDYKKRMNSATTLADAGEALVYALEYFFVTVRNAKPHAEAFRKFVIATKADRHGSALQWFRYTDERMERKVSDIVAELIRKLVNDHLHVAYNKLSSNGDAQVHKLLIEENYLVHIADIEPRFTTPRLKSATNFLLDLKLIERISREDYRLTAEGEAVLNSHTAAA